VGHVPHGSATTTAAVRRAIQLDACEPEGAGQAPWDQPEVLHYVDRGRGDHCRVTPFGRCLRPHVDIAEVQTAEGRLRLFVAIDRTCKFAFVELHTQAGKMITAQFLRNLIAAVPYAIHTVLTDNSQPRT
jgi:hypothetical protein